MALSDAGSSLSRAPGLQDVAAAPSVADTTSDYRTVDNSGLESTFVKTISQNYNVDELRRILSDIYCSTVHSLNLEVIQMWLHVVQDIRAFLLAHENKDFLQLYSKSMHLRLTTCWNEILYAIIGHVRHAPNLLGQTFQRSAGNKKLTFNSCIACFCHFCNEVGLTWNKGVSDILGLLRDILTVLKENRQDSSLIETWIRQAEESQANITSACTEFQKSFKVLSSLVDEEQVPSEALLMHKLFTVCTGEMRQSLESEMMSQLQDEVLMSDRCVSSAAVLQAKTTVLKAWNDTVGKLLATFARTWAQDTRLAVTDIYITALETFYGSWARILCSVMVATDLLESDFIRVELDPATVKAVQAGIVADLSRETDLMKAPRTDEGGSSPASDPFPLTNPTYWYKNWLALAHSVEQSVFALGDLLTRQEKATTEQASLSRLYQGAASCLERYEQACCVLRHFALFEANTNTCAWQMSRACEKLLRSLTEHLAPVGVKPTKLRVVQNGFETLKVDLLTMLRDLRKERAVPENYVAIFRSHVTEWLGLLQIAADDIRQEALEAAERMRAGCSDRTKLDECIAALPSRLEEGCRSIEAQLQRFCANETWKIDDIGILAHLSKSRSTI
ncbi:uncharacterized protein [Dermacentor albipictus]|uniref:uncharacterized protein n=1 Tax=Dermacentor albipictus TaxID=60249 RepID=UPI0031FCF09C